MENFKKPEPIKEAQKTKRRFKKFDAQQSINKFLDPNYSYRFITKDPMFSARVTARLAEGWEVDKEVQKKMEAQGKAFRLDIDTAVSKGGETCFGNQVLIRLPRDLDEDRIEQINELQKKRANGLEHYAPMVRNNITDKTEIIETGGNN